MNSKAEFPTLLLIAFCYAIFGATTLWIEGGTLAVLILAITLTLFSSLQHEVIHGHPFKNQKLNDALVFPALGFFIPYVRFKDTHLAHHFDPNLTDPYEDPETNFVDVVEWYQMTFAGRLVHRLNTTLAGRMIVGPTLGLWSFYRDDFRAMLGGNRHLLWSYLLHFIGLVPVLFWLLVVSDFPFWQYLLAAYFAMSILKIRTYLEHRAHAKAAARSVIIEDQGVLAFLFLNNNYHAVHHSHPNLIWHRLPKVFEERRSHYLRKNDGYSYRSYWSVFVSHFVTPKDGPTHPLWSKQPALLQAAANAEKQNGSPAS